ncbi:hypothetical protein [Nitrincola sp.]|uniref:hypothetical protein n=1 Tax=Nitrincola sp. TaxID=1926584 RepID=UPI003A8F3626
MWIVKLFSKVVLLLLLLLLIAYGLYYYQVKSAIDAQLQQMRPLIEADYGALYVNPLGDIQLSTVTFTPMGQPTGFIVDNIRLTSDPLFFLRFESRVATGDWPDELALAIEGLHVDFNMPLFVMLTQLAQQAEEGVQPEALGCGTVRYFDMSAMRMMGMRQGRFDFHANLRKAAQNRLDLELLGHMYGWGEVAVDVSLQAGMASPQVLLQQGPQLKRMVVSYQDKGYNQRKNQFCAMQSGLSIAEYRDQHLGLIQDWLNDQAPELTASLMSAYRQTGEPGARMVMSLNLDGVDLRSLDSPEYLGEVLASTLSVSVNDQPLALDSEQMQSLLVLLQEPVIQHQPLVKMPESSELANLPRNMPGVSSPPAIPEARLTEPQQYRRTDPQELENYIGHPVRFYTTFGKRVDGILVSVEDGNARVAERVQHGTAQYPVELESLQATEVFR